MIKGCFRWNDRERAYFTQVNNALESLLKAKDGKSWLESCGPTTMINCLAAEGVQVDGLKICTWAPQPEDIVTLYLNDPRNSEKFKKARQNLEPGTIPGNRVPQYYPDAAEDLYGVQALYSEGKLPFDQLAAFLKRGVAVQLCLVNPGHYIAAVAFDDEAQEIIFNDPWPGRFADGNGFNVRMGAKEYEANVKPFAIIYNG